MALGTDTETVDNELDNAGPMDDSEFGDREAELDSEVAAIEAAIFNSCQNQYMAAKAQQQGLRDKWRRWTRKFRGTYVEPDDGSIFYNLNIAYMAKILRLNQAQLKQLLFPDQSQLDFFTLTPQEDPDFPIPQEVAEQYAAFATMTIQNDMREMGYIKTAKANLLDGLICGNAFTMPVYECVVNHQFKDFPNPEYVQGLPPEYNCKEIPELDSNGKMVFDDDGQPAMRLEPIQPFITKRIAIQEKDAPKIRYINPLNIFVSELDRQEGASACDAVWIYDTVHKKDLWDDDIENGGYLYRNLDEVSKIKPSSMTTEIDGYDGRSNTDRDSYANYTDTALVGKLKRVTGMLLFDIDDVMGEKEISDAGKKRFYDKWACEPDKRHDWNTWVSEIIEDKVQIRMQPLPYYEDKIAINHWRYYPCNGRTFGDGQFNVGEKLEMVSNSMARYELESILRNVRPMYGIVEDEIDGRFLQAAGGKLVYEPYKIIPLAGKGSKINDAMQEFGSNPTAAQYASNAKEYCNRQMDELCHTPAVKQGEASGGNTATEVQKMSTNADVMNDETAQDCELEFLEDHINWLLRLYHQFGKEERTITKRNEAGIWESFNIPPEVWLRSYQVNIIGYRTTGNAAVRAYNYDKFVSSVESLVNANPGQVSVNVQEVIKEYAKLLQIRDSDRLLGPPIPPAHGMPQTRGTISIALKEELLPASVVAKIIEDLGIELDPNDIAAMGAVTQAATKAAQIQRGDITPPKMLPTPGQPQTQPGAVQSIAGPEKSHHAVGERSPNRGVGDEVSIAKGVAQRTRNPAGIAPAMRT